MRGNREAQTVAALRAGDRLLQLDGLRGIAILLVLFLHYIARTPLDPRIRPLAHAPLWLRALADMSWCGVDLFFVLSGFLIGGILLDHRESPNLWRAFYARRVGRIFPAYYLLLIAAAARLSSEAPSPERMPLAPYFAFVQNLWPGTAPYSWLGPCWSIAIEEQFYLAAPAVLARVSPRSLPKVLLACIVAPLLLRSVLVLAPGALPVHWSSWDFTLCRIDGPSWGVLGAWLVRDERWSGWLRERLARLKWSAAVLVLLAALMSQARPYAWNDLVVQTIGLTLLSATSLALILIAVLDAEGTLARVLRTSPLAIPGQYSYFVYLFHLLVFAWIRDLFHGPPLWRIELVSVLLLGLMAWLSWRFFEQPLLKLARSVRYEPAPVAGAAVTTGV